jgi:hypothetical protein
MNFDTRLDERVDLFLGESGVHVCPTAIADSRQRIDDGHAAFLVHKALFLLSRAST